MLKAYNALIENNELQPDPAQQALAEKLEKLSGEIAEYESAKNSIKSRYLGRKPKAPNGMFIVGKVGRGKSMLVDLFMQNLDIKHKKSVHFHEFMRQVHKEVHLFRQYGAGDPVEQVAHEMAKDLTLLAFDEYEIKDVTNAMILSKLFGRMIEEGVVLIFTSNKIPEEHYKDGLQRQTYLDFCKELEESVEVFSLDAEQDYRLTKSSDEENFFTPLGYSSTQKLKEKFKIITGDAELEEETIEVDGREIKIRGLNKGKLKIAWVSFDELCGQPLGTGDYLTLAKKYKTIFLEDIPQLDESKSNEARRFINLIDVLYEKKARLICTAEAEPAELYTGKGKVSFEFKRTVSRLEEMRNS